MILLEIEIDTKVAIASAIIAGLALLVSIWSGVIAKKAINLSKKQYNDKQPDYDLYFIQGFRFLVKDDSKSRRLLLFQLTIRNKSEFRNTLKAELEIEYLRENDSFSKILLDHNPSYASLVKKEDFSIFPIDIEIEAKATATRWLIFEQPNYITKSHRIEKYCMRLMDINGNLKLSEAVLIKDVEE